MSAGSIKWINNARDVPLNANTGTVPEMSETLAEWYQPMTFGLITKTIIAGQNVESVVNISFRGVWQPLHGRKLDMRPQGQRQWDSYMLHSDLALSLKIDDVVNYLGKQYRVMTKIDYSLYKYQYYELLENWKNSGPPTP